MSKVLQAFWIIAFIPRFLFLKVRYGRRFTANLIQIVSTKARFRIKGKGGIHLDGRNELCDGVVISCVGEGTVCLNDVFINRNATIVSLGSITVGKGSTIAPNVCIFDHDHSHEYLFDHSKAPFTISGISIGENVWICSNAVICKGVRIGDNSVVAAGSVVVKDVPANTMVGGVPARVIKSYSLE